jgi:hypothetical protein
MLLFWGLGTRSALTDVLNAKFVPEGYPEPRGLVQTEFSESVLSSSQTQPSMQASLVTLAAILAAPTILNFESAFVSTVKRM